MPTHKFTKLHKHLTNDYIIYSIHYMRWSCIAFNTLNKLRLDCLDPFQEFFVHFVRQGILDPMSSIEIHDGRVWAQLCMHLLSECSNTDHVLRCSAEEGWFRNYVFRFRNFCDRVSGRRTMNSSCFCKFAPASSVIWTLLTYPLYQFKAAATPCFLTGSVCSLYSCLKG